MKKAIFGAVLLFTISFVSAMPVTAGHERCEKYNSLDHEVYWETEALKEFSHASMILVYRSFNSVFSRVQSAACTASGVFQEDVVCEESDMGDREKSPFFKRKKSPKRKRKRRD